MILRGSAGRVCHLENVKFYMSYLQQLKQTALSDQTKELESLIDSLGEFDYQFSSGWPKEVNETLPNLNKSVCF
jgi:hypothetical protein